MSNVKYFLAVSFLLLICGSSCSTNNIEAVKLGQNQTQKIDLNLSEEKTITVLDSAKTNRSVSIKFVSIDEGRCLQENCELCYGGYATVTLSIRSNSANDIIKLYRPSCVTNDLNVGDPSFVSHNVGGIDIGLSNLSELLKSKPIKVYSVKLLIKLP